jgi:hypothetical protein
MTLNTLTISGKYELLALHRALMEARFSTEAGDPDVSASPMLASLHRTMVTALMALAEREPRSGKRWNEWLALDMARHEWSVAVKRGADSVLWKLMDSSGKASFAADLLAPFDCDERIKAEFVCAVEREIARREKEQAACSPNQI